MKKPIGIFGGTFDPIHLGHIQLAKEIYRLYHFQEIRFVPCHQNSLKNQPMATAAQRLDMVKLAIEDIPGLIADEREVIQGGPSYTIDTVRELRNEIGNQSLCLIMATDTFAGLPLWKQWQQLVNYAHFLVGYRPGFTYQQSPELSNLLKTYQANDIHEIYQMPAGRILFLDLPELFNVAATDVRALLLHGKNPKDMLPKKVQQYIEQHHLYSLLPRGLPRER